MADLTRNKPNMRAAAGPAGELLFPEVTIKSGVQLYQGGAVFRDPADSALLKTSPAGNPMFEPYGVSGVKVLGDGTLRADVIGVGPHIFENASSGEAIPTGMPMGWPVYAKDNQTASRTNGSGTYPFLGWFGGWTGESTPRPIVWVGFCPFALHEILIPAAKGHADLTAAATSQSFNLYTLPGPARVMHPPTIDSLTAFTGGSVSAATLAIGIDTGSDVDAIGDEKSIFTGGAAGAMTAGVLGYPGALIPAGTVITATFATVDDNVVNLSAGAVVAHVRLRPGA